MKNTYSVQELMESLNYSTLDELLKDQRRDFTKLFGFNPETPIELELKFQSMSEMIDAYNELKFTTKFNTLYKLHHHAYKDFTLVVSGQETLFDYLGSNEPNLLTLSRITGVDFDVYFEQSYTGTQFTGKVVNGELLARQCLVEVNDVIPALTLGLLNQIGKTTEEFDLLLTRIIPFKSNTIL